MIAEAKDYYEMLGISRQATGDEIRSAFRKLARRFHPDLADDKILAEEIFKGINEAYEILGDPDNRRQYDRGEGRWKRFSGFGSRHVRTRNDRFRSRSSKENFRPYTERPEFRSFHEEFLGGRGRRTGGFTDSKGDEASDRFSRQDHCRWQPQRGQDLEGEILLSLEAVLAGSIHTLSVVRNNPLTGDLERRPLHVRIPAGVQEGQVLRLSGKGDYGIDGGQAGDLFLRVKIAPHPTLRVRGRDLICELELNPWEAFFGAAKMIRTLEGDLEIKVPGRTTHGQRLRLRGHGLPNAEGARGDLYAIVSVKVRFKELAKRVLRRK